MAAIFVNCPVHRLQKTAEICVKCVQETNDRVAKLTAALAGTPELITQLFDEGTRYKNVLRDIATGYGPCACPQEMIDGDLVRTHYENCAVRMAIKVLHGHETRVLAQKMTVGAVQ